MSKSDGLKLLSDAGLRVPPFVVLPAEPIPAAAPWLPAIIRSNASVEDGAQVSAAGAYASEVVLAQDAWVEAWNRVVASRFEPAARAVASRLSLDAEAIPFSVIVQRYVEPRWSGAVCVQRNASRVEWQALAGGVMRGTETPRVALLDHADNGLPQAVTDDFAQVRDVLERFIGHDLEWVHDGRRLFFVQCRPHTFETSDVRQRWGTRGSTLVGEWHWDAEHNPSALSFAHESLIALLGRRDLVVLDGYLYQKRSLDTAAGEGSLEQLTARLDAIPPSEALDQVLAWFCDFADVYAGLSRGWRAADQHALTELLAQTSVPVAEASAALGSDWSHATWQSAQSQLGGGRSKLPLVWDIALPLSTTLPSDSEASQQLGRRLETSAEQTTTLLTRLYHELPAGSRAALADLVKRARAARRLQEADDHLFARALDVVRQAWLRAGQRLCGLGVLQTVDQVFLLTVAEINAAIQAGELGHGLLAERDREHRARRRLVPPTSIISGEPIWPSAPKGPVICGHGTEGIAVGTVRVYRGEPISELESFRDVVLVCAAVVPALAPVLAQVRAVISDHGGLLSHGAFLARELGIPAVVGTRVASERLRDGERVWVDGASGRVVSLDR